MSAKNIENTSENRNFLASQNDVEPARSAAAAVTAGESTGALQAVPERTSITSGSASVSPAATTTTMVVDETAGIGRSSSSGGGGPSEKRRSNDGAKRKTRRGKAKRGKRSSSSRPYTKSQWKFQSHVRIGAAVNKRRAQSLSDHPPLVPYNTNRFLMEDHMPQVLTPSEDEEEFLTKEFSSVYEDARSERLEGLSKTQLIQEYLQLEANFEQVTRRFAAKAGGAAAGGATTREENESAVIEGGGGRRLEDRIRELTAENLELRRQLEHASRIGMVLSAKSSPRPHAATGVERMDSSSCSSDSEDSESDSSSSSSSSSGGSSSSSMSDDDGEDNRNVEDRQPLVAMMDGAGVGEAEPNGYHQLNGIQEEDALPLENGNGGDLNGAVSPLSSHSINSPPPPLVMN